MIDTKKFKFLGSAFVAFEAIMHVYLSFYLVVIKASILAIGFTIFELTMFIYLLVEKRIHKEDAEEKADTGKDS